MDLILVAVRDQDLSIEHKQEGLKVIVYGKRRVKNTFAYGKVAVSKHIRFDYSIEAGHAYRRSRKGLQSYVEKAHSCKERWSITRFRMHRF